MINARSSCALPIQDAPTRTVIKNHARKYEYVNVKCSALTVSIGIDVCVRARVANLKQQLSQMSIVETLLPTDVQNLLSLKANKKMVKDKIEKTSGKKVTLKDLSNISTKQKSTSTRNDLKETVTQLTEMYDAANSDFGKPTNTDDSIDLVTELVCDPLSVSFEGELAGDTHKLVKNSVVLVTDDVAFAKIKAEEFQGSDCE
ncbi:hypothetical protein EMCRGX_G001771 [Ephydatia muelleri]